MILRTLFTIFITLQFVVVALHDLVNIRGWAHGKQVAEALGRGKVWIATAINSIFPGLAMGFAYYYWNRPRPAAVTDYWLIYCGITMGSAIAMWYVPYFFGASEKTKRFYSKLYEGTQQVLPARGDNPRPNLLHIYFHVLFAATLVLAVILRFGVAG